MKIFYKFNGKGVPLETWLDNPKNREEIQGYLCLYILRANMDKPGKPVLKFGIAGTRGGTGAEGRLRQYFAMYGYSTFDNNGNPCKGQCKGKDVNKCIGVDLLYLAGTKYNKNVLLINTEVFKREKYVKDFLKKNDDKRAIGRGAERTVMTPRKLYNLLTKKGLTSFQDEETELRRSERNQQERKDRSILERDTQTKLTPSDKIVQVVSDFKQRGSVNQYRVKWSRPFEYDDGRKPDPFTYETASFFRKRPKAEQELLAQYKAKKSKRQWVDD